MPGPFPRFPKVRPPLPREVAEIHLAHYRCNRSGASPAASLSLRVEGWMHRKVAADVAGARPAREVATLEIGAGTLNQLPFEPDVGPYDIVEPFTGLYEGSPLLSRVRTVYGDIADVPAERRYDRITSVATFEHILDLPSMVARAALLLAPGGCLRTGIPSEGTPLWTLAWKLTTGVEFRMKHGLDYGLLMRHEHVNTAREIREVLEYFFADVRRSRLGPVDVLSLYQFLVATEPRTDRCRAYLAAPA
ncbi:MAG TPA: hypothetical protein VJT67_12825 [Longimicrobiaceae bacterium]|nr:hypothetical protein [Longimicrobiaceae bacterium]